MDKTQDAKKTFNTAIQHAAMGVVRHPTPAQLQVPNCRQLPSVPCASLIGKIPGTLPQCTTFKNGKAERLSQACTRCLLADQESSSRFWSY